MILRIAVVGSSGSGKSTLAHRLAVGLDAPVIELDAAFHQPDWEPLAPEVFRRRVHELVARERWVIDGNYGTVRDIVWGSADLIVWLDLPKRLVMTRVIRRTLVRIATARRLWNGNREVWRNLFEWDPYENIIRWTWTMYEERRRRYEVFMATSPHRWVRLRTTGEVEAFVRSFGAREPQPSPAT